MRIYGDPYTAVRETERELYEMGIDVHPQTMQDKVVADDPEYKTKELRAYGFQIVNCIHSVVDEVKVLKYLFPDEESASQAHDYIGQEFTDRLGPAQNPGQSYRSRPGIWGEFLHGGKFAYTYSERIAPQFNRIMQELRDKPDTRQAIINIHSNIRPSHFTSPFDWAVNDVQSSADLLNMGGSGRIPCSMYYQFMRRLGQVDMIYTMRSCDFLTHFPVDLMIAMRFQTRVAIMMGDQVGTFTYFTGSMHAYYKDLHKRGIF